MIRDNDGSGPSILPLIGGLAVLGGLCFMISQQGGGDQKKEGSQPKVEEEPVEPTPEMYPVEGEPNLVDVEIKEALSIENGMMK